MRAVVTVVVATEVVRAKRELSCRERKAVQKKRGLQRDEPSGAKDLAGGA